MNINQKQGTNINLKIKKKGSDLFMIGALLFLYDLSRPEIALHKKE